MTLQSYYENISKIENLNFEYSTLNTIIKGEKEKLNSVNEIFNDIKKQHSNFTAFFERNYNDATKKIYEEIYNTEITLADQYRLYAIKVFIIIAFIACITFMTPWFFGVINWARTYEFKTTPVDTLFFVKSLFMLLLTAPGWYFARESAKHRQVAYKAKSISAELSALPYYISDLNQAQRHEMRIKMADKFFGQELYSDKKIDSSELSEQTKITTETLKTVSSLLSQQIKKQSPPNGNG